VAACIFPEGGWEDLDEEVEVLHPGLFIDGEIVDSGQGTPSSECWDSLEWVLWAAWDVEADATQWVSLADTDGVEWVVAVSHPDLETLGTVGEAATLEYQVEYPAYWDGVGRGYFSFSVGGQWIWMGRGFQPEALDPPDPVVISSGDPLHSYRADGCGRWTSFAIDVRIDGQAILLEHGETRSFGGYIFTHGGYDWFTDQQLERWQCADVAGLGVNVGVLHPSTN